MFDVSVQWLELDQAVQAVAIDTVSTSALRASYFIPRLSGPTTAMLYAAQAAICGASWPDPTGTIPIGSTLARAAIRKGVGAR